MLYQAEPETSTSASGEDADAQVFLDKCRPKLEELEGLRLEKLDAMARRKKLAIPIAALCTPFFGFIDYWLLFLRSSDDGAAGLTIFALGGLWAWVTGPKRQYARAYKNDLLPEIAGFFGDFSYDAKGKIPMELMKPSKVIPQHTAYRSEDYFSGEYKKVGISFSEIKLRRKSGKSTVTVFDGLAVLLTQGAKKFHGHTILIKDQGGLTKWLKPRTSGFVRADLVDPEFEEIFDVYTTDQVEARYLMDPRIIENLKLLYREYTGNSLTAIPGSKLIRKGTDQMMAAFYDDQVLILIGSSLNHFEPADIQIPATDEEGLLAMKREIGQILSIVDKLSLYDPRNR